jgi:hypothetical protein
VVGAARWQEDWRREVVVVLPVDWRRRRAGGVGVLFLEGNGGGGRA